MSGKQMSQELSSLAPLALALCSFSSHPKALAVLAGANERLDHLGVGKAAPEAVEFTQPEVEAGSVRIASEIAEVLHRHKRAVELTRLQELKLGDLAQHSSASVGRSVQARD